MMPLHADNTTDYSCIFNDYINLNQTLNLTYFAMNETVLKWNHIQDDEIHYAYEYTPCQTNSLHCDTDKQGNGQIIQQCGDDSCCFVLAEDLQQEWVSYDESNKIWSLHYIDGSDYLCPNNTDREVTVYWHCNLHTNPAQIVFVNDSIECSYEIDIESQYACPSGLTMSPTIYTETPSSSPTQSPTAPTTANPSTSPIPLPNDCTLQS